MSFMRHSRKRCGKMKSAQLKSANRSHAGPALACSGLGQALGDLCHSQTNPRGRHWVRGPAAEQSDLSCSCYLHRPRCRQRCYGHPQMNHYHGFPRAAGTMRCCTSCWDALTQAGCVGCAKGRRANSAVARETRAARDRGSAGNTWSGCAGFRSCSQSG